MLVDQPLFVPPNEGISLREQARLSGMLLVAAHAHAPVRVAVIGRRDDLGEITALWHRPQAYARFVGVELSLSYRGPLLVVMPNGFGLRWPDHATAAPRAAPAAIRIGPGGAGLAAATETAIETIGRTLGVTLHPVAAPTRRSVARATSSRSPTPTITNGATVAPRGGRSARADGGAAASRGAASSRGAATPRGAATSRGASAARPGRATASDGSGDTAVAIGAAVLLALLALLALLGHGGRLRAAWRVLIGEDDWPSRGHPADDRQAERGG